MNWNGKKSNGTVGNETGVRKGYDNGQEGERERKRKERERWGTGTEGTELKVSGTERNRMERGTVLKRKNNSISCKSTLK